MISKEARRISPIESVNGMLKLKSMLYSLPEFEDFLTLLEKQRGTLFFKGIYGSAISMLIAFLRDSREVPLVVIVPSADLAEKIADDLQLLLAESQVFYFPSDEVVPFDKGIFTPALHSLRLKALVGIFENRAPVLITTPTALFRKVISLETLKRNIVRLKTGEDFDRELLIDWLVESGYQRVDTIEEIGQFSVRGGILDVFSYESETPVRLEFFGDTIESIREFDVLSQLSTGEVQNVRLLGNTPGDKASASIFDYFGKETILFFEAWESVTQLLTEWWQEIENKIQSTDGEEARSVAHRYFSLEQLQERFAQFPAVAHAPLAPSDEGVFSFGFSPAPTYQGNVKLFISHLQKYVLESDAESKWSFYIQYDGQANRERLEEILEAEIGFLPPVKFLEGEFHQGFVVPRHRIEVITDHEIFNRIKMRRRKRRIKITGSLIRNLQNLSYGDYLVHVDYGIGKYMGSERIKVAGIEKECLKLLYEGNDVLYVNLDKLNRVQRYVSEEGMHPKLTRLGSSEWDRIKKRTRKAVEKIARDLVKLYARRMTERGHAFSADTLWQKELEASFPFEPTVDQEKATEEVKRDMESPRPMDRLVCGDVGYGKTEIAIRAAFKAVMDGKQVAVLVPTTILAQQHFNTFRERMCNFPVNIEVLSRFRTAKEQKEVLKRMAIGDVDVVIGTHRLLSSDVQFKDLGLLIIDEEQRFGVKHKEKLKELKVTVDTITLSATPIPRTLHMALLGARDLSNVDTPPGNRHPIITEITTWDSELIYKAITYEINRGGQVFFVHNRVQSIGGIANLLKTIVPKARIAVAHGQMREKELEQIMRKFYEKQFDVLVATMIIENGLDIPNCNTIIVNRADRFGLAQLYQLRGRVGRSDRQAYAYLIVPPPDRLNENALKRLYAIEEFGDLGAGLKIAMRDLEIRGAGNLLGHQQSGFINAVGYDLYQKILRETVESVQEESLPEEITKTRLPVVDAAVDVDAEMFIPDDYIPSSNEKVMVYHRLLNLDSMHAIDELVKELRDRFGPLPPASRHLIEMVKIKKLASNLYISQVKILKNTMTLIFDNRAVEKDVFIENELPRYVNQTMAKIKFIQDKNLRMVVDIEGNNPLERLSFAKNFLQSL